VTETVTYQVTGDCSVTLCCHVGKTSHWSDTFGKEESLLYLDAAGAVAAVRVLPPSYCLVSIMGDSLTSK